MRNLILIQLLILRKEKAIELIYLKKLILKIFHLKTFVQEDCQLFQEQLQADLRCFKHGIELLEQALNAIRVRVEIDQADRDHVQSRSES